jgi:hypothetical protein
LCAAYSNVHNHARRLGREAQSCIVRWLHVDRVTHVDRLRRSKNASPRASAVFMLVIPLHKECREHTTAMMCEKNVSACSAAYIRTCVIACAHRGGGQVTWACIDKGHVTSTGRTASLMRKFHHQAHAVCIYAQIQSARSASMASAPHAMAQPCSAHIVLRQPCNSLANFETDTSSYIAIYTHARVCVQSVRRASPVVRLVDVVDGDCHCVRRHVAHVRERGGHRRAQCSHEHTHGRRHRTRSNGASQCDQ